jgi:hypothetical protein
VGRVTDETISSGGRPTVNNPYSLLALGVRQSFQGVQDVCAWPETKNPYGLLKNLSCLFFARYGAADHTR